MLELTGDYHRPIAYWLVSEGIEVHLASSLVCARVWEAMLNSWGKHDRKDVKTIMYLPEHRIAVPFSDSVCQVLASGNDGKLFTRRAW